MLDSGGSISIFRGHNHLFQALFDIISSLSHKTLSFAGLQLKFYSIVCLNTFFLTHLCRCPPQLELATSVETLLVKTEVLEDTRFIEMEHELNSMRSFVERTRAESLQLHDALEEKCTELQQHCSEETKHMADRITFLESQISNVYALLVTNPSPCPAQEHLLEILSGK